MDRFWWGFHHRVRDWQGYDFKVVLTAHTKFVEKKKTLYLLCLWTDFAGSFTDGFGIERVIERGDFQLIQFAFIN